MAQDTQSSFPILLFPSKMNREVMLGCLMDIREKLMNSTEKYTIIPVHALADDLADYACEVCHMVPNADWHVCI
jgi:hypothetical protein